MGREGERHLGDAMVEAGAFGGQRVQGRGMRPSGAISADSRTLLTELTLDNAKGEVLAGSYAQVSFPEARIQASLTLPANTLLFRAEGAQVGVVGTDSKVELHNVSLGRDFGPTVEILSGVTAADRVILNPSDSLVSGTVVNISEPAKAGGTAAPLEK